MLAVRLGPLACPTSGQYQSRHANTNLRHLTSERLSSRDLPVPQHQVRAPFSDRGTDRPPIPNTKGPRIICAALFFFARRPGIPAMRPTPSEAGDLEDSDEYRQTIQSATCCRSGRLMRVAANNLPRQPCGRGRYPWPASSGLPNSSEQPSDSRPADPTSRGILPARDCNGCEDDASET